MKKYTLDDYALLLQNARIMKEYYSGHFDEQKVEYLTFDSKKVTEGTLFICKGAAFKAEYLDEAIEKGAIAYVSEKKFDTKMDVPYFIVDDIRRAMPMLAEKFNNAPWKDLKIIGIGGTKGKSTAVSYMKAVLDDYAEATGGNETALLSTMSIYDGVVRKASTLTTPEAVDLQEHLRHAVESNIEFLQMEVSSQALKYGRVDNMRMEVGIFLNISEDHISPIEHPDFEDYFSSKLKMFKRCKYAVVNKDADFADRILDAAGASEQIITFSMNDETADVYGYHVQKDGHETVFQVRTAQFDEEIRLAMPGLFNVENALSVIAAAMALHIPLEYVKSGLARAKVGGRMELYASKDAKKIAIVDFAHNKLSFEKLFSSAKEEYPDYKIVTVFGSPGNKANIRRQHLGEVASQFADKIYLTADDPADERVEDICNEIAKFVGECPYEIIEDRTQAIWTAMEGETEKTVFLITGKGDEAWLKYGKKRVPCKSDVENVKAILEKYDNQNK